MNAKRIVRVGDRVELLSGERRAAGTVEKIKTREEVGNYSPTLQVRLDNKETVGADRGSILRLNGRVMFPKYLTTKHNSAMRQYRITIKAAEKKRSARVEDIQFEEVGYSDDRVAQFERDGFSLTAKVEYDPYGLCDFELEELDYHEVRDSYARIGHARNDAHNLALKALEDRRDYIESFTGECPTRDFVAVSVDVSAGGVSLSGFSLSGIESDAGDDYFVEVANDLAYEAVEEAQKKLGELMEMHARVTTTITKEEA